MESFCLLKNAEKYQPLDWDLITDTPAREFWLQHFREVFPPIIKYAREQYGARAEESIQQAEKEYFAMIDKLDEDPTSLPEGKLDILLLDRFRDRVLRLNHIPDVYLNIKAKANDEALEMLPGLLEKIDSLESEKERWLHLVKGVFAGNIYDLGSVATLHLVDTSLDFWKQVESIPARPWFRDDFDSLFETVTTNLWKKLVIFPDNAGPDFVLGVLPMLRELARNGCTVVVAPNELPSLNDMTLTETICVLEEAKKCDPVLTELIDSDKIMVVNSGNDLPLIDLNRVATELNVEAFDADCVILEGMGRSVETNFDAEFKVDCLKICTIKNESLAERIGAQMFDNVCLFEKI